jgi:hypothetical protein
MASFLCKKRADDLLKLRRHQLKMVVAILTGHVSVGVHLYTISLFDGNPACRFCRRLKQCRILFAAVRHLVRQRYNVFGNRLVEPKDKYSLSKGPVTLYKRHRVIESVLIGIFRVAQ